METTVDTIVIGAGQAGLATGHELARRGHRFEIVDGLTRVGDSWRERWEGLRLFTPARYDGLPGMAFPAPPSHYPSKDEVADFLERYAQQMALPVRTGVTVERLVEGGHGRFRLDTDQGDVEAERVIVAAGAWREPRMPAFAKGLSADVQQLHSSEFHDPSQVRHGPIVVVGASNSGAEIAHLLAPRHEVWLAGRDVGQAPFDKSGPVAPLMDRVLWFFVNHVMTVDNPIGRRVRASWQDRATPLEGVRKRDLADAGVKRVHERVVGVVGGMPQLAGGQVLTVGTVIWATGFQHAYPWIDLSEPVIGDDDWPLHERGVSTRVRGLYFMGLPFQSSLASPLIGGVGRDARFIAEQVVADADASAVTFAPAV
jgi:putative flavoprotein involved in K+ transport